jgi:hypothetical protein
MRNSSYRATAVARVCWRSRLAGVVIAPPLTSGCPDVKGCQRDYAASVTPPEAGDVVPTIPLLERISTALDADLIVEIAPHAA